MRGTTGGLGAQGFGSGRLSSLDSGRSRPMQDLTFLLRDSDEIVHATQLVSSHSEAPSLNSRLPAAVLRNVTIVTHRFICTSAHALQQWRR